MMTKRSQILIMVAALLLGLMYVAPIWTIDLEAPQYPEGIGMLIQIDNIEGKKEHDLKNINNLNHYIGMYPIEPDEIPELKIMPALVGVLMALGLLVGFLGRKKPLYAWVSLFTLVAVVGMADFYKWEYEYGHNLDEENAIIKIPGMSYQPPLIGSRQILNFTAHSWPGVGGWAAILACGIALTVAVGEWRRKEGGELPGTGEGTAPASTGPALAGLTVGLLFLTACGSPQPRPLLAGTDDCERCLMMVDGSGYGSQAVSNTGRVFTFDSVECLVSWLEHEAHDVEIYSTWVTDFANPEELVNAEEAFYLLSTTLNSPMGLGITAFSRTEDRDGAVNAFGGTAVGWDEVKDHVEDRWPGGHTPRHGGHSESLP